MPQMEEAIAQTSSVSPMNAKRFVWIIALVAFGLLWFELINQLKPEWWLNPQYNYGLIVPLLALYLFWKRWRTRPAPEPPAMRALAFVFIFLSAAIFLPIRFLSEANPDWRLLSWLLALVVAAISLSFIYLAGGRAWLRHFAFPVLFTAGVLGQPLALGAAFDAAH